MVEWIASFCLVAGTFFVVLGALGLLRMPDVYSRLHAVTKSSTLGLAGVLASSALMFGVNGANVLPEVLTILFVFLTNPVGGHMIARSAYLIGVPLTERSVMDAMKRAGEHGGMDHDQH